MSSTCQAAEGDMTLKELARVRLFPWICTVGLSSIGWFFVGLSFLGFVAAILNHGFEPIRQHEPLPRWIVGPLGFCYGLFFLGLRRYWSKPWVVRGLVVVIFFTAALYVLADWWLVGRFVVVR